MAFESQRREGQPGCTIKQFFDGELHSEFRADADADSKPAAEYSGREGKKNPVNRSAKGLWVSLLFPFLPKGYPDSVRCSAWILVANTHLKNH